MIHLLTSDLLITRISRGKIKPEYAAFNSENLELAELLIETFEQHVGKTYGDLLAELEGYEDMNFRFIRGLSQLLGRRAVVETSSAVDPSRAREAVFNACEGMALSPVDRKEAIQKAANKFSISMQELEKALWADLEENQILKEFDPLPPVELLRQYNISLTQTLLFRAVDLDIWIRGDFQKVLWKILRSGLMYSLEDTEEDRGKKEENEELKAVHLHLEGPASLFRMSERYGNSFAKIFPTLLRTKGWSLKAGILHKGFQGKRILDFTLNSLETAFNPSYEAVRDSKSLYSGLKLQEAGEKYKTGKKGRIGEEGMIEREKEIKFADEETEIQEKSAEEESYDSTVEQAFGSLSLGSWKIKREPTILKAGKHAFVPDFSLQRNSLKVYLEIIGFWTPEYLEKKVEKLQEVKEPLILLIDRKLKCSEKDFPAQEVIFFDKKIPANEVMKVLRKYEEKKLSEEKSTLQEMEIPLSGKLIKLNEIAAEKGVMIGALKEVIENRLKESKGAEEIGGFEKSEELEKYRDYVLLENFVIHRQLLENIDSELQKSGLVETYADAVKIFKGFELDSSLYYSVLEHLGYKVSWAGLSEEDAKVRKI